MTPEALAAVRERIRAMLPDGQSVLMQVSRTASRAEWDDLRDWYMEAVAEFYAGFAISWDGIPVSERQRICERAGLCWSRSLEMSVLPWASVTPSVKRQLYRWLQRANVSNGVSV